MHNIKLVIWVLSIIVITFVVFIYIGFNSALDDNIFKISDIKSGKNYEYGLNPVSVNIPEFSYNIVSLFPRRLAPAEVKTKIITNPLPLQAAPSLTFVGMIETDEAVIYSFRDRDTNKMLLFEEGVELEGIILLSVEARTYRFKKDGITFQVEKE